MKAAEYVDRVFDTVRKRNPGEPELPSTSAPTSTYRRATSASAAARLV